MTPDPSNIPCGPLADASATAVGPPEPYVGPPEPIPPIAVPLAESIRTGMVAVSAATLARLSRNVDKLHAIAMTENDLTVGDITLVTQGFIDMLKEVTGPANENSMG